MVDLVVRVGEFIEVGVGLCSVMVVFVFFVVGVGIKFAVFFLY